MMVRIVALCIVLTLGGLGHADAENIQARYDNALNLSASGDNVAAYDSLISIEKDGYRSGNLYYNLAVIATKLDSLSIAKLYYITASHYSETHQRALEGISYLDSRFPQRVAELPRLPWEQFFDWLQRTFGLKLLYWSVVLVANVGVILFMLGWYLGRPRWLRGAYMSAALFVITFLSVTLYIDKKDQRYDDGVLVSGQHALKEHPDASSAVVSQVYEGFAFTIDYQTSARQPGWVYVRMSNGMYGWLPKGVLRTI